MAYPSVHKLLAFGGTLRTDEAWTCSMRMTIEGFDGDQAAEQALCDNYADVLKIFAANNSIIGSDCSLEFVKWNTIGTDGRYLMPYTILTEIDPAVPMGSGTSGHVNQAALVVTLETGVPRGLANRGRLYLPLPRAAVGSTGRITSSLVSGMATQMRDLLDDLNGIATTSRVCVASGVREGAIRPVTSVRVGDVIDTMRSRRAQVGEFYSSAALAALP